MVIQQLKIAGKACVMKVPEILEVSISQTPYMRSYPSQPTIIEFRSIGTLFTYPLMGT